MVVAAVSAQPPLSPCMLCSPWLLKGAVESPAQVWGCAASILREAGGILRSLCQSLKKESNKNSLQVLAATKHLAYITYWVMFLLNKAAGLLCSQPCLPPHKLFLM